MSVTVITFWQIFCNQQLEVTIGLESNTEYWILWSYKYIKKLEIIIKISLWNWLDLG